MSKNKLRRRIKNYKLVNASSVFPDFEEDHRKPPNIFVAFFGFFVIAGLMGILGAFAILPVLLPASSATEFAHDYWDSLPTELPDTPPPQRSIILDANGDTLAEFFSENRVLTNLEDVSPNVVDALISTEDKSFYEHGGVDYKGIARALASNVEGNKTQGASTITQQLVKNTRLVNAAGPEERAEATENSIARKMEEVSMARHLEETQTKEEILERYLNIALFSNGVYGIGTASDYYFSKKPADLDVSESALLVGLVKNPTGYDPIDNPETAQKRRDLVLGLMLRDDIITQDEHDEAIDSDLDLDVNKPKSGCNSATDPLYCQWILDSIRYDDTYGDTPEEREQMLYRGGLTIETHYDPEMVSDLRGVTDRALGTGNRVATAITPVEPGTGIVSGFAQNHRWGEGEGKNGEPLTQINYSTSSNFQTGSAFKVFTLLAALESGVSPDATFYAPKRYKSPNMNTPSSGISNFTQNSEGNLNAYQATRRSSNTWYAVVQEKLGVLTVADMAESLGIPIPREGGRAVTEKDASFTLGTTSVSPMQMSAAYAAIAGDGMYCEPHGVKAMTGPRDEEIDVADGDCHRVFSQQTARTATSILRETIDSDDPVRTAKDISMDYQTAGKTGTTNDWTEVWFMGSTPQYTTAVWVGDPRGAQQYPLASGFNYYGKWTDVISGGDIAAPIWKEAMDSLHSDLPKEKFPVRAGSSVGNTVPNVVGLEINAAVTLLEEKGYEIELGDEQAEDDDLLSPNHIASQSPTPHNSGPIKDGTITLTLTYDSDDYVIK